MRQRGKGRETSAWFKGACMGAVAAAVLAFSGLTSTSAWAEIKIGRTAGITGAVAGSSNEAGQGAALYLDAVNARGGVLNEKIQLITLDDKFDPKLAAENAKQLIAQDVIALFLNRGTPHSQALLPLLAEAKIPLIAPSTGAMVLHDPLQPWVFNTRTTYRREAERLIHHLDLIGVDRIAIVQVDDTFGEDAVVGALKALTDAKKKPLVLEKYDRAKPDFSKIMPKVTAAEPQSVLFIGSGTAVVDGMRALRATGSRAQMVTLSNNASSAFIKDLGGMAHGVVVGQVFPSERSQAVLLVKEAIGLAKAAKVELTPSMLEGFVAAKVLVEGLRRAGPQPTGEKLRKALEGINRFDLGGMEISYSPRDHTGLEFVDLSIIGEDGKFQR